MMNHFNASKDKDGFDWEGQTRDQRDLVTQSIISIALGLIAFLTFCVSGFFSTIICGNIGADGLVGTRL